MCYSIQFQRQNESQQLSSLFIQQSRNIDSILIITILALLIIGILASCQILPLKETTQSTLAYAMYGLAALAFIIEIVKLSIKKFWKTKKGSQIIDVQTVTIDKKNKNSLNLLLGEKGDIDSLPHYPEVLETKIFYDAEEEATLCNHMDASVMKGLFKDRAGMKPCLIIKMQFLCDTKKVEEKFKGLQSDSSGKYFVRFLFLYQDKSNKLFLRDSEGYGWRQLYGVNKGPYPYFFNKNFTFANTGELVNNDPGFSLLQKLIAEGQGEDLNGIKWKIV